MNESTETRSVVIERELPYPPEKIWRALTQPHLIEEWLMKSRTMSANTSVRVGSQQRPERLPARPPPC